MEAFIEKAKEATSIPYMYGHSDVGDVFVRLLQGEYTEEEAIQEIEFLIEDYTNTV